MQAHTITLISFFEVPQVVSKLVTVYMKLNTHCEVWIKRQDFYWFYPWLAVMFCDL